MMDQRGEFLFGFNGILYSISVEQEFDTADAITPINLLGSIKWQDCHCAQSS